MNALISNLVNGTVVTTLVLYYAVPLMYVVGLLLSFCICSEATENFVAGMAFVRVQTTNIVGFVFCLKMCKPDAADHIAADPVNSTHVAPAE